LLILHSNDKSKWISKFFFHNNSVEKQSVEKAFILDVGNGREKAIIVLKSKHEEQEEQGFFS
jgi:hypothetical protein